MPLCNLSKQGVDSDFVLVVDIRKIVDLMRDIVLLHGILNFYWIIVRVHVVLNSLTSFGSPNQALGFQIVWE